MDTFLLENVGVYQKLVRQFRPEPSPPQRGKATMPSPDMVVSARIRPLLEEDKASGFPRALFPRPQASGVVDIHDLYHHPRGRPVLKSFNYEVDRLFGPGATAQEIYDAQVADLVAFARGGGTGTLFAYGQTGSGKTTTISGLEKLVVEALLGTDGDGDDDGGSKNRPNQNVYMSIIELAGNSAYDLLRSRRPIQIMEDAHGVTRLTGAEEHLLVPGPSAAAAGAGAGGAKTGAAHATALIERAVKFRHTASTKKNDSSSRSHSICRLRIVQQQHPYEDGGEPSPPIITSMSGDDNSDSDNDGFLYLVDLAGSEAARDVATHGADRMREAREINISLSVLKECIRGKARADAQQLASLAQKSKQQQQQQQQQKKPPPHIPFRQSALTKILKHVFDPTATPSHSSNTPTTFSGRTRTNTNTRAGATSTRRTKTVVVACVNPSLADVGPSKNTLRYAEMLRVSVPLSVAEMAAQLDDARKPSSRDPDSDRAASVPFRERIRPGMAVRYVPSVGSDSDSPDDAAQLAVVLSRFESVGGGGGGGGDEDEDGEDAEPASDAGGDQYLCAQVTPGAENETYEVNLWKQVVVDVSKMEREVILEYDAGTRYYQIAS